MHVQPSRSLRKGALCNLTACTSFSASEQERLVAVLRCAFMLPHLPNRFAWAVRRLWELPLATRLAHDEIHAVLRLAFGGSGKRMPRVSVARKARKQLGACLS